MGPGWFNYWPLNHKLMEVHMAFWFQNVALDNVSSVLGAGLVRSYLHWHGSCCLKAVLAKVHLFRLT